MGLIYLDTCIVIYAFEDDGARGSRIRTRLGDEREHQFAISPLVRLECLVAPMGTGNLVLQRYYENGLDHFVQLALDGEVCTRAAQLRARFSVKTADALHLAAAQVHGCEALWTNDDRLARASHDLAVDVVAQ